MKKSITKYFTMKNTNLTFNETLIYAIISWKSDNSISHITRNKLSELSGIKDLDTISKYTSKLEKENLITKEYKYEDGKKLVTYKLNTIRDNYTIVYNRVFEMDIDVVAFCIKLAALRFNGTAVIKLSKADIAKQMGVSKPTFYKFLKMAETAGVVFESEGELVLSIDYFPVFKTYTAETREKMNVLLSMDDNYKGKKVFMTYYATGFEGLRTSVDFFVDYCLRGCVSDKKSEIMPQVYAF